MESNEKISYQDILYLALRYAGIAMVLNIFISLYTDHEEGLFAEILNLISFSMLYGILLFYTIHSVKQVQNDFITYKRAFLVGLIYLVLTGIVQAIFVTYIKNIDLEELRNTVSEIWRQNSITEEQISQLIIIINEKFVFMATFFAHILVGIVSLIFTCLFVTMKPSKDKPKQE